MIRLSYVSAEQGKRAVAFEGGVIRFGTHSKCEVRLEAPADAGVARHHGEFVCVAGTYLLYSRDAQCGIWVDGKKVERVELAGGERIRVGSPSGPEIRVLEVKDGDAPPGEVLQEERTISLSPEQVAALREDPAAFSRALEEKAKSEKTREERPTDAPRPRSSIEARMRPKHSVEIQRRTPVQKTPSRSGPRTSRPGVAHPPTPRSHSQVLTDLPARARSHPPPQRSDSLIRRLFRKKPQAEVAQWLSLAQDEIEKARSQNEGYSSGNTMVIMARALTGIRQTAEGRARGWRRRLIYLALGSLVVIAGLGGVIVYQQQRIGKLVREKTAIDVQIQSVFDAMSTETDQTKLAQLEARLEVLMGSAADKVLQVSRSNPKRAGELAETGDELERDIRRLLRSFNAETYAIPPIFKRTVASMVTELAESPGLRSNYRKKQTVWPMIQQALQERELPAELGYITFTESRFEPRAVSPVGAAGMWQLMPATARTCGLIVTSKLDERFDPTRATTGAACYLSRLLIEFGQESFMLVLASYNRGENGVRHALHKVALEPGGYKRRDFWHLYRLKLLPDETRDYVPRVLAAALVFENPQKYGLEPQPREASSR